MFSPPAVVVHGLDHVRMALRPGLAVTLLSAPGAAAFAGVAWWRALIRRAQVECGAGQDEVLDCGDAPGYAMSALRLGQRRLILAPDTPGFGAVAATAATCGATLLTARPPSLDLATRGAERRLDAWLRG